MKEFEFGNIYDMGYDSISLAEELFAFFVLYHRTKQYLSKEEINFIKDLVLSKDLDNIAIAVHALKVSIERGLEFIRNES